MIKDDIEIMISNRNGLFKKDENDPVIDLLRDNIVHLLKKHHKELEVDFIIESLTHMGIAPALIYDDNGNFALSADGYQPISTDEKLAEGVFMTYIKRAQWRKSIREAVALFLKSVKFHKDENPKG